jgi:hypothetical protein
MVQDGRIVADGPAAANIPGVSPASITSIAITAVAR